MNQQNLSSQIRAEVKAALLEYGFIGSQATAPTKLSEQEYRQVRRLAWRIIEGYIDVDEIDQLSARAKQAKPEMAIIALPYWIQVSSLGLTRKLSQQSFWVKP